MPDETPHADLTPASPALPRTVTASPGSSELGRQAARGASVTLVGQVLRIVIQVGSVAFLARLLDPFDYGLVAIVLAVVGFGEIIRDSGLSTAAVQSRTLSTAQRNQMFWLNTAIGAGLTATMLLAAPLIATMFRQPQLTGVSQALAFTFLLNGMTAQYRASLNRQLRFAALITSDIIALVAGVVVAVILALSGAEFWALVAQQLTTATATLLIMTYLAGWLPGRPRRGVEIKSMTRFGHGLMASQLVGYVDNNVDTYTIGLALGATPLGLYNRAFQLLMRPLGQLRAPTTTVALPVLSRLADEPERLGRYVIRGQLALGYTLVSMMAFAAGAAVPLVDVLLGPSWSEVAPIFAVLAIGGAFQTLAYVGFWVYLAKALTGQLFRYSLVSLTVKVVLVLIGSNWGLIGIAVGFSLSPALLWPLSLWWLSRLTPLPLKSLCFGGFRVSAIAALAGASAFAVTRALPELASILQVLVGLATFIGVYGLGMVLPVIRRDVVQVLQIARKAGKR